RRLLPRDRAVSVDTPSGVRAVLRPSVRRLAAEASGGARRGRRARRRSRDRVIDSTPMAAVVTGLGVVSPFGLGVDAYLRGLRDGTSATRRITLFDPEELPCQVAAEVPGFDPAAHLDAEDLPRVGRIVPLSIVAAREALLDAGLAGDASQGIRGDVGVMIGSGAGAADFAERQYESYYRHGIRRVNPDRK